MGVVPLTDHLVMGKTFDRPFSCVKNLDSFFKLLLSFYSVGAMRDTGCLDSFDGEGGGGSLRNASTLVCLSGPTVVSV